jgi:hypothetical protein
MVITGEVADENITGAIVYVLKDYRGTWFTTPELHVAQTVGKATGTEIFEEVVPYHK